MVLTIQIVNYNSRDSLKECLISLGPTLAEKPDTQVIVINNESGKIDLRDLPVQGVEIIEAQENLGFGRAHNLGSKQARGELIFFLNPDTRFSPEDIARLAAVFERNPEAAIVGPWLAGSQKKPVAEFFGRTKTPLSILFSKLRPNKIEQPGAAFPVDWISGGAMMIRKNAFCGLGGFDEKFFMYYEDVDLCLRAKRRGHNILVDPTIEIIHLGGKSYESEKMKKKHYYVSQKYYLKKNYGSFWACLVGILRLPLYIKNVYLNR